MEYWEIGAVVLSAALGVAIVNWLWDAAEEEVGEEWDDYWRDR